MAKKFVIFNGEVNNIYVVPVVENNGYDVGWNIMQTYKEIRPVTVPSVKVRCTASCQITFFLETRWLISVRLN